MTGDHRNDNPQKQPSQEQAPDKQKPGSPIGDRTSKAQEDAAKERANEGGYQ